MRATIKRKKILYFIIIFFSCSTLTCQINFSPSDFSGLEIWLVGDSIYSNTSNTIDTIYDLSINKNHATQNINYLKPTYSSNVLNGHKAILFDGIDDFVGFNEINDIRTVFWVLKEKSTVIANNRPLLGHTSLFDFHRGSDNIIFSSLYTNTLVTTGQTKINFNSINPTISSLPNNYNIISLVTMGNVNAEFFSKDRANILRAWDGELVELIIYNRPLSSLEVSQIENYLNIKYAPPISLPPDIILSSFCNIILHPINSFNNQYSFQWSTGATSQSISINTSGKYWVRATNIFGVTSTDTINVYFPEANKLRDTSVCNLPNMEWNTQLPKNQFSFLWQDNSTDSLLTISSPGIYSITISDAFGCSVSHSINVTQDNFSTNANLGPDLALCSGNQIALTTGIQPGLTYTWSTGQNGAAITVTNTGQYSVIVTNTNNCVAKDTIDVTITGFAPEPQFSNNIACKNQTVHFTDLSLAPPGNTITTYFWNFGDPLSATNTSTLSNPIHTYADTGFYQVNLQIQTDVGCAKAITKTIHVASTPTVNYTSGISCQNDSTSFVGSAITAPYSVSSYKWDFGDPISGSANFSSKQNPKHLFSDVAFFPVKFLVTNSAGCKDSITKNINVRSQVKADFSYQPPCSKTNVVFQDNSTVPNPSASHPRIWVLALQTNTFTFSGLSFSNTFTTTGVYPLSLTVNGTNGCSSTISKLIQIYQKPSVDFVVPPICLNDTIQILNNSLPGSGAFSQFSWSLNSNTISSLPSPTINFSLAGTYSLSLIVSNTAQCKDSVTKTITVNPLPNVTFTSIPPTYIYKDSIVTFVPSLTTGNTYNWVIGGQNYAVPSPTIQIDSVGTFSVNLSLVDQNGCKNSGFGTFKVYDSYLDLEVNSIIADVRSNNYLNVQVDVTNKGTIPIANFEIKKTVSDASQVKETFNGIINPGVSYRYQFNSEDNISNDLKNRLICVELESINKSMDQNIQNNALCDALNTNEVQIFEPQPNPASEMDVLLPVIVNFGQEIKVELINSLGEIVSPQYSIQLTDGLNYIKIPSSGLNHGSYLIKLIIEDKTFVKKLLKY
jgi:PKD repeat protein